MSVANLSIPAGPFTPELHALFGAASDMMHPVLTLAIMAALFFVFRPLLAGVVRATVMLVIPRRSLERRKQDHHYDGIRILNRMAQDYSCSQPSFAAELRSIASRDSDLANRNHSASK